MIENEATAVMAPKVRAGAELDALSFMESELIDVILLLSPLPMDPSKNMTLPEPEKLAARLSGKRTMIVLGGSESNVELTADAEVSIAEAELVDSVLKKSVVSCMRRSPALGMASKLFGFSTSQFAPNASVKVSTVAANSTTISWNGFIVNISRALLIERANCIMKVMVLKLNFPGFSHCHLQTSIIIVILSALIIHQLNPY